MATQRSGAGDDGTDAVDPSFTLLGLDPAAERTYLTLARDGAQPPHSLDGSAVARLVELGLAEQVDGLVDARPPRGALEAFGERHRRVAVAAQEAAEVFGAVWHAERAGSAPVQIHTAPQVDRETRRLLDDAEVELCAFSLGPRGNRPVRAAPGVLDALARGVDVRVVYDQRVLADPRAVAVALECLEHGERGGVVADVPVNMVLSESRAALTLPYRHGDDLRTALVRDAGMVAALRAFFEGYWARSIPLGQAVGVSGGGDDPLAGLVWAPPLLQLLGMGLTDQSIARELRVSERTVGRRVTRLQQVLGAGSRFQLGAQAARRGLL